MARLTRQRRQVRLGALVNKASGNMIPHDHIRFKHRDDAYEILSPITSTWQEIRVSEKAIQYGILPAHVCDAMDYYVEVKKVMEHARDLQVFNEDLRPICQEEKQLFGVREGENNPCFPKSFYGINRSVSSKRIIRDR